MTLSVEAKIFKEKMNSAIQREYEVAKARSFGDKRNQILNGKLVQQGDSKYLYEFMDITGNPPEEGMKIVFTVDKKTSPGKYLGETESKFLFEVEDNFGEDVPVANISSDPLFLVERQVELLKDESLFENQLALASIGIGKSARVELCNPKKIFAENLNLQQKNALQVAGENAITYIWGPPGTGKTTTMGSIVAALAELGKKVLLISNTNLAVDTALERCLDRYSIVAEIKPGLMLRFGKSVKQEIIDKYSSAIDLETILAREIEPLQLEISKKTRLLANIKDALEDINREKEEFKIHADSTRVLNLAAKELADAESELKAISQKKTQYKLRLSELALELKISEEKNAISRVFSGMRNPGQIRAEIDDIKREQEQKNKAEKRIKEALPIQKMEVAELQKSAKNSILWLEKNPSERHIEDKRTAKIVEQTELQKVIAALQEQITGKKKELLERARVIACTAYKPLLDKEIAGIGFDAIVIDEASMIPLSLYYCIAARAKERLIIAGDFRQLPPIVNVGNYVPNATEAQIQIDKEYEEFLTQNPFTISKILNGIGSKQERPELVALRDQYRMRTEISELISEYFYSEHTLRTVNEKRDKTTPWGNETFIVFDTSKLGATSTRVEKSWRNIVHSLLVKALVDKLVADGWTFASTSEKSFGIMAPFAKQRFVIKTLVEQIGIPGYESGISTVHSFQGNERDLMILDLTKVSSEEDPTLGRFLGNVDPLSKQNAIWNVGFSRARQHVLIVADLPTLERNSGAVISKLVKHMINNGKIIDGSEILNIEAINLIQSLPSSESGSLAWYTGESFYKTFEKDLRRAKESVFIASPFTAKERTTKWEPTIRDLVAKKVEVRILTKPLTEKNNYEESLKIHNSLGDLVGGIKEIPKMHEKLAVLDEKIAWLGSLNILSHAKASELMVRIESANFAKALIAEYDRDSKSVKATNRSKNHKSPANANDKCDREGCSGTYVLKHRRSDGKPFLSCSNWQRDGSGCRSTREVGGN